MMYSRKLRTAIFMLFAATALHFSFMEIAISQETTPEAEEPVKPKIKVLPPAYDEQMMRLAEILGALHYLRELCGAKEEQLWRDEMKNLLVKEEPTPERRALLIARFNRGFRGFNETYRECTDAAIEANNRYIRQGTRLANEIPSRYGR